MKLKPCLLLFILLNTTYFVKAQCFLEHLIDTEFSDTNFVLYASNQITAQALIGENAEIAFKAGNSIQLLPGFQIENGVDFLAKIENCPDSLIEILGNIPKDSGINGKARNIWDLQLYEGEIYIGFGSTIQNTGPTPLWVFNPIINKFDSLGIISTEAIERLSIWNDTLFIPNSDPNSGDLLKFSYVTPNGFQHISLNHPMAHVRAIYFYQGRYYLVGNTRCPGSKETQCAGLIALDNFSDSYNNTLLQSELIRANPYNNSRWNWFFGLLEVDGQLIIPNGMFTRSYNPNLTIKHNLFFQLGKSDTLKWSTFQPKQVQLNHAHFYTVDTAQTEIVDTPGIAISLRIFENQSFQNKTIYSLRTYSMFNQYYQSEYNNSAGLMLKDSLLGMAKRINFSTNAVGEDLKVMGNRIYALVNEKIDVNRFKVCVYSSESPTEEGVSWQKITEFDAQNMARAFEYYDGYFYFGLGFNNEDNVGEAGLLVRLKYDLASQ